VPSDVATPLDSIRDALGASRDRSCNDPAGFCTSPQEAGLPAPGRPGRTMRKSIVILLVGALLATWAEGHAGPKLETFADLVLAAR